MKKHERERMRKRAVEVLTELATRYHFAAHSPADADDFRNLSRMPSLRDCRGEHFVSAHEALLKIGPEIYYTDKWMND